MSSMPDGPRGRVGVWDRQQGLLSYDHRRGRYDATSQNRRHNWCSRRMPAAQAVRLAQPSREARAELLD